MHIREGVGILKRRTIVDVKQSLASVEGLVLEADVVRRRDTELRVVSTLLRERIEGTGIRDRRILRHAAGRIRLGVTNIDIAMRERPISLRCIGARVSASGHEGQPPLCASVTALSVIRNHNPRNQMAAKFFCAQVKELVK